MKDKKKDKKGGKTKVIIISVLGVLVLTFALLLVFDVFGLRTEIITPYLRNAPLIGRFFGEADEGEPEISPAILRIMLANAETERDALQRTVERHRAELFEANNTIEWLQWFQGRWEEYIYVRARLDQILAHAEPELFLEFYAGIHPDNLDALVREILEVEVWSQEIQMLVATFNGMEAEQAGEALELLMVQDTELMLTLMRRMSNSRRSEIWDTLEPDIVAAMTQLMATEPPVFAQFTPPPQLAQPPHPALFVPEPPIIVVPEADYDDEYYEDESENGEEADEEEYAEEDSPDE